MDAAFGGGSPARRSTSQAGSIDARVEPKVKIVGVFPDDSHLPIVYPVAATSATMNAVTLGYIDFLRTGAAKIIFEKYGFSFMNKPVS